MQNESLSKERLILKKTKKIQEPSLINITKIRVRFSEVDSMRVVWHGEYVRYFEDGREAFGHEYQMPYLQVYENGYVIPIVELSVEYKSSLHIDEVAIVETRYINSNAAKIIFEYIIRRESNNEIVATGRTVQIFVRNDGEMEFSTPDFYLDWKRKMNIIK